MKFTNMVLAASAAGMAVAYPSAREVVPAGREINTSKRSVEKRANGFTWFGVSESGAEFGSAIPGTLGKDYTWPVASKIQVLRDAGMNVFRVPFLMERLVPGSLTGSFDATYLAALKSTVNSITKSGAYAVLDPHNYGRYGGSVITSTADFQAWWKKVAGEFSSNDKVIFDTNNEYNNMDQTLVLNLNQAAIDGIRAAGATSQYIFVEGNAWTGAWSWTDTNDNMKNLKDPQGKIVYEMHQYLDGDKSGTSESCVSATIGSERLKSATAWLKANNKKGFIGEFAGGANSVCESAVEDMLSYMQDNSDVWTGASWWSAGPWWGSYMYSLEPTDGPAYAAYLPILKKYFPNGSAAAPVGNSGSSPSTTTKPAPAQQPATTKAPVQITTTAQPVSKPISTEPAQAPAPVATSTFTTKAAGTTKSACTAKPVATQPASPSTGGTVGRWSQCGGMNWTGATACESPYKCVEQNPYYSQCL
ncbi:putative endo-beta-1,4-glucanase B [Penicillium oxalicum]|uniref:putative endo-beta-1,4-glucanase B n=1 Tax=Penicillium oxalicum TaxID=69781 RepID=UPI0020B7C1A9|nr:putative endo-beta-1,4-glucanase B [Penicillium oxalicum]KAI2787481.1 putative endo-beta-1,4-glucanase B [Penicillium oxalicum]